LYEGGKGTLSFISSYTDKLDDTSIVTFELGADYGSDLVCSVTIDEQIAWSVKSCYKTGTKIIIDFNDMIIATAKLKITLKNVIWPTITTTTLISATVTRFGGITAYSTPTSDQLGYPILPESTTPMIVSFSKKSNSVYTDSEWWFTITPSTGTEFSSTNFIYINIPSAYNPEVGRLMCNVGEDVVPCMREEDYWIKVSGPGTPTGANT